MLGTKIDNLLAPTINFYESNEPNYFPDIYQMTEQTSNFERLINEMKANSKTKNNLKTCSNPNCNVAFSGSSNCHECISCGAKYCTKCIKKLEMLFIIVILIIRGRLIIGKDSFSNNIIQRT